MAMNEAERETFLKLEKQRNEIAALLSESEQIRREMQKELEDALKTIRHYESLATEGQQAHQEDLADISLYQKENAKYAEALQVIADGRGKYAKVARDALDS